MRSFKTIGDLEVRGRTVLLRADLNVPMADGKISDDTRIARLKPTVAALRDGGARVVLMSHFGRPKGQVVPEMSLRLLTDPVATAFGAEVVFADDCVGPAAERVVASLPEGGVALLENLRFHPGEEANDPDFAAALAALGDIYVNDAFSASHRAHASIEALARLRPAAAGLLLQAELEALTNALERPARPLMAVVGGAKVSTKLDLLANLTAKVDSLVIGGGMANTFLHAQGIQVGRSLCERDLAATARDVMARAEASGCEIVLPGDVTIAAALQEGVETRTVSVDAVPNDMLILDVGPATAADLGARLQECKSLVWNGPLGAFETAPFDAGTTNVARRAAELTKSGHLLSVAGGGDTVAALTRAGVIDDFSYVSTAGGAFLEWLEGKELPGVAALAGSK